MFNMNRIRHLNTDLVCKTIPSPVGGAVGCKPIGIIVPCQRIIGKNGDLAGFGGELYVKIYLLDLEGKR